MGNNNPNSLKFALTVGIGAFFAAVFFSFFSEIVFPRLQMLILSLTFLILIILVGIIFDMIGVAVAVSDDKAFHAKAAKKIRGAGHSLMMVRNADKVATLCNDVVGDICGTVSGALGVTIIIQVAAGRPTFSESFLSMIMTGFVAALTVGGKAAGKRKAMEDSEKIVFMVGKILAWFEHSLGLRLLGNSRRKGKERKKWAKG